MSNRPTIDPLTAPPDVTGEVVYVGDYDSQAVGDLHGEPVVIIRTARAALKAGPPLVYRRVRLSLEIQP